MKNQFKKSRFAIAKINAGINELDFESFSSDHSSDQESFNAQLRLELDRFYEA